MSYSLLVLGCFPETPQHCKSTEFSAVVQIRSVLTTPSFVLQTCKANEVILSLETGK